MPAGHRVPAKKTSQGIATIPRKEAPPMLKVCFFPSTSRATSREAGTQMIRTATKRAAVIGKDTPEADIRTTTTAIIRKAPWASG